MFYADVVATSVECCNGGGSGPRTVVQYEFSGIGIGPDQVLEQCQWFLRGVYAPEVAVWDRQDVRWVPCAGVDAVVFPRFYRAVVGAVDTSFPMTVWFTYSHLGVVSWQAPVEYEDIFMS